MSISITLTHLHSNTPSTCSQRSNNPHTIITHSLMWVVLRVHGCLMWEAVKRGTAKTSKYLVRHHALSQLQGGSWGRIPTCSRTYSMFPAFLNSVNTWSTSRPTTFPLKVTLPPSSTILISPDGKSSPAWDVQGQRHRALGTSHSCWVVLFKNNVDNRIRSLVAT